jgi:ferritin-like metal-binding protein YciE
VQRFSVAFPNGRSKEDVMNIDSFDELFLEQLKDIYDAEKRLVNALPKMARAASNPELREAIEDHLEQTRGHVDRLEEIFESIDEKPTAKKCKAMVGLIEEGDEMLSGDVEPDVRDAGIIAAAQKVEHYEIASYGTLRTFADLKGEKEAARLLQETLDEEKEADKKLTEVAESAINLEAAENTDDKEEETASPRAGRARETRRSRGAQAG